MERAVGSAENLGYEELGKPLEISNGSLECHDTLSVLRRIAAGGCNGIDENAGVLPAFQRLPGSVIDLLLYAVDANTFASLLLLNRRWRSISETASLYAHHLRRSPSFVNANHPQLEEVAVYGLPKLKKLVAQEVVRNLYEAYLRPQQITVRLISISATSSAAFPQGESFHFFFSLLGRWAIATNSCRIYLIDVRQAIPQVQREFAINRPNAVDVLDDGSLLAVLLRDHQVNVYDIQNGGARLSRSVCLETPGKAIALSPDGSVLAIANEDGIEVISLAANAKQTDRRAVRCGGIDSLTFSSDGTRLLGTSTRLSKSKTVLVTTSHSSSDFPDGNEEEIAPPLSHIWTTQILFPTVFRECSHAAFLPSKARSGWLFAYDKVAETFGVLDVDEMKYVRTTFSLPSTNIITNGPAISSMPTVSDTGELVAVVQSSRDILLYGIPEGMTPPSKPLPVDRQVQMNGSLVSLPLPPQLAPKVRVAARIGQTVQGVSAVKWCVMEGTNERSSRRRLVAVAPGGVSESGDGADGIPTPIDGGRVIVLDFDYSAADGGSSTITIEVGGTVPEVLEQTVNDMELEVSLARRRTLAQGRLVQRGDSRLGRSITSASNTSRRRESYPSPTLSRSAQETTHRPGLRRSSTSDELLPLRRDSAIDSEISMQEAQAVFGDPYSHSHPRSRTALQRAATAAAMVPRRHLQALPSITLDYRRADGRRQLPHESDADGWVPPPPPYTPDPSLPLPDHLRVVLLPQGGATVKRVSERPTSLAIAQTTPVPIPEALRAVTRAQNLSAPGAVVLANPGPNTCQLYGSAPASGTGSLYQNAVTRGISSHNAIFMQTAPCPVVHIAGPSLQAFSTLLQPPATMSTNGFREEETGGSQRQRFPSTSDASVEPSTTSPGSSVQTTTVYGPETLSRPEDRYSYNREPPQTREIPNAEYLHSLLIPHSSSRIASSSSLPLPGAVPTSANSSSSALNRVETSSTTLRDNTSPARLPSANTRDYSRGTIIPRPQQVANLHRRGSSHRHRSSPNPSSRSSSHLHSETIAASAAAGGSHTRGISPGGLLRPPGLNHVTHTSRHAGYGAPSIVSRSPSRSSATVRAQSTPGKRKERSSPQRLYITHSVGSTLSVVSKRQKSRSPGRNARAGVGTTGGTMEGANSVAGLARSRNMRRTLSRSERSARANVLGKKGRAWGGKAKDREKNKGRLINKEVSGLSRGGWMDVPENVQRAKEHKKGGKCVVM